MTRYKGSVKVINEPRVADTEIFNRLMPSHSEEYGSINLVISKKEFSLFLCEIKDFVLSEIGKKTEREKATQKYTVPEVCGLLKTTPQTLNRWEKTGYLIPERIGCRVYYPTQAVDNLYKAKFEH